MLQRRMPFLVECEGPLAEKVDFLSSVLGHIELLLLAINSC